MKIVIAPEFQNLKNEIQDISALFNSAKGVIVYEGRNSIRNFNIQGVPVTIKRFKRVNPAQQVAYTFFKSTKAERAYRYAAIFRERGICTPQEIAYIEDYEHGLFTTGYFVSTTCPDPPAFPTLVPARDTHARQGNHTWRPESGKLPIPQEPGIRALFVHCH